MGDTEKATKVLARRGGHRQGLVRRTVQAVRARQVWKGSAETMNSAYVTLLLCMAVTEEFKLRQSPLPYHRRRRRRDLNHHSPVPHSAFAMAEIRRKLVIVGDGACGKVGRPAPSPISNQPRPHT